MTQAARSIRWVLYGLGVTIVVSSCLVVNMSAAGPYVPTYSGCYSPSSGTINKMKLGDTP